MVGENAITGTLKYLSTGPIASYWGAGYFMALTLADTDFSPYTSVLVGMDPSEGSGLVEILNDDEHNLVAKVTDKSAQDFKAVSTDGARTVTQTWDLDGLTLSGGA